MIYQSEAAECGLASIAMVANQYGHKIDLSTLRSRYNISFKGANLQQLMQLAEQLNMVGRALRLELDELKDLKTPCILHWDMNHFVVLKQVSRKSITILDPEMCERVIPMKEVDASFTGIALELTPTSEFTKKDERAKLNITSFWTRIDGLTSSLVKLFVLSLILQFLMLAAPYYTQLVVDNVLVSFDKPLLVVLALGFGLVMLVSVITDAFRSWVVLHLSSSMSVQMATNLMRHLVHLPMEYFDKRHMGDVVSRFGSLNSIRDLFTKKIVEGVIDGLMSIVVLVMMFLYDVTLALVVLGVVIVCPIRCYSTVPLHC